MAVEIITRYPLPDMVVGFGEHEFWQRQIERRLGAIEESLSRVERMLSEGRGPATE